MINYTYMCTSASGMIEVMLHTSEFFRSDNRSKNCMEMVTKREHRDDFEKLRQHTHTHKEQPMREICSFRKQN